MRWPAAILALAVCCALFTGCGHSSRGASPRPTTSTRVVQVKVPRPPLGRVLPPEYRAQRVWRAYLVGGSVPEVVLSSVGPLTGSLGFHPADLQVLSWEEIAGRWTVVFDGQKVTAQSDFVRPETSNAAPGPIGQQPLGNEKPVPLLDPNANVTIGPVRFAHLLPGHGQQLIFTADANYGGSGSPGELVVVDFSGGIASVVYSWFGDGGVRYRIDGPVDRPVINARAWFWTDQDAHCCPLRTYRFTVGRANGRYLQALSDQRPWLGVYARAVGGLSNTQAPLTVIGIVPGSPAASKLRVGDVIVALTNAPTLKNTSTLGALLVDQIDALNAGEEAMLEIRRDGSALKLAVHLGSLIDASVARALPPNDYSVTTL